jgi:flavorubredoxin
MKFLTDILLAKKLKNRHLGVFGNYGWSGGAVKALREFAADGKFELVEPVVEARFAPTPDQLEQCRELGRGIAAKAGPKA